MISVCLATYNGEKYLSAQLESIMSQLEEGDELLVSDDGSDDRSWEILQRYASPQLKLFRNHFRSPVKNFEFLLRQVSRPIVVLCDQDDIWLEGKLELIRQRLQGKKHSLLLMNARLINADGEELGQSTFEKWQSRPGFWANLKRNCFMGSSMAFSADLLKIILPIPPKVPMHDWWIGLLASRIGQVEMEDKPQMLYRLHGANTSLQGSTPAQKLLWRRRMFVEIIKRLKNVSND